MNIANMGTSITRWFYSKNTNNPYLNDDVISAVKSSATVPITSNANIQSLQSSLKNKKIDVERRKHKRLSLLDYLLMALKDANINEVEDFPIEKLSDDSGLKLSSNSDFKSLQQQAMSSQLSQWEFAAFLAQISESFIRGARDKRDCDKYEKCAYLLDELHEDAKLLKQTLLQVKNKDYILDSNYSADYKTTIKKIIDTIFLTQREFGNIYANEKLESEFLHYVYQQIEYIQQNSQYIQNKSSFSSNDFFLLKQQFN